VIKSFDDLSDFGTRIRFDASLATYTTFGVGGPATVLVEPHSLEELERVAAATVSAGLPLVSIGQGSNLLISDDGVEAVVVVLGGSFTSIERHETDPTMVTAGAAVKLPVLARQTVAMGLTGFEWAVGVPGSVGGAIRMNAGGHGSDMAANVVSARVLRSGVGSERIESVPLAELGFSYRTSNISDSDIVLEATFRLESADSIHETVSQPEHASGEVASGEVALKEIVRWRREHQPGGANCGSVFTNPPGDSAGRLIDAAGLKGHRIGTAQVSPKHANFIQADPGATAKDVSALIVYIQTVVFEQFQIQLHAEVKTLGITTYQRRSGRPGRPGGRNANNA
jgi:UDP-N-acetylmuramate dehydrogenase